MWNLTDGSLITDFVKHKAGIKALKIIISNVVAGYIDGTVIVWNLDTSDTIFKNKSHGMLIRCIAINKTNNSFAIASDDNNVEIWNIDALRHFSVGKKFFEVSCIEFLNKNQVILGDCSGNIIITGIQKKNPDNYWKAHDKEINSITILNQEKIILTSSDDHTVKIWNDQTFDLIFKFSWHRNCVLLASFIVNQGLFISISKDKTICLWNTAKKQQLKVITKRSPEITKIAFSDKFLALGSHLGDIIVYRLHTNDIVNVLTYHNNAIKGMIIHEDLLISCSEENKLVVYNLNAEIMDKRLPKGDHNHNSVSLALSVKGKFLISGSDEGEIIIFDFDKRTEISSWRKYQKYISCIAIASSETFFMTGYEDGNIFVWDFSGQVISTFQESEFRVSSLCIDTSEKYVVSGSTDNFIIIWNLNTKNKEYSINPHKNSIQNAILTEDQKFIVICSNDSKVTLWDIKENHAKTEFCKHLGPVNDITIKGDVIASCSEDGTANMWNMTTGDLLGFFEPGLRNCKSNKNFTIAWFFDGSVLIKNTAKNELLMAYYHNRVVDNAGLLKNSAFTASKDQLYIIDLKKNAKFRIYHLNDYENAIIDIPETRAFQEIVKKFFNNIILTKSNIF